MYKVLLSCWPYDGFCSCSLVRGQSERCVSLWNMWDRPCRALISSWRRKGLVCIFTCAVFRAVHLELLVSLSTGASLQALRIFIAWRGRPSTIYCDNRTNFRGAECSLRRLDMNLVFKHTCTQRVAWKFNPPGAPWWGGWWEHLIRVIKLLLRRTLGRACLTYRELAAVFCDCEAVVNARPLKYMSSDGSDLMPLTPPLFLQDVWEVGVPDCDFWKPKL